MQDIVRDGKPHSAVGILVTSEYVRAGTATAYPHPNQFFHAPVEKGQSVYVNTDIKIGGCGGEGYRNYLIAPWTQHQDKLWQVVAETVEIMVEETKPGAVCQDVARAVHEHQVKRGMQEYIYHRPGHGTGQNFVGHQPPYLALGDETVIEEGMMFSVEPGLMDPSQGVGINPSDNLLVTDKGSVLMTRVPFSKEWSYLTLT
jgi:Xaa-Pro aminopeptidase